MGSRLAVVGGGIAGLTAATDAARAGHQVTLLERAPTLGGKARTEVIDGFHLNFGVHALYRNGVAEKWFKEIGSPPVGHAPPLQHAYVRDQGQLHAMPSTPPGFLRASFLNPPERMALIRTLMKIMTTRTSRHDATTWAAWLDANAQKPRVRRFIEAFGRVASYSNEPTGVSAGLLLRQCRRAASDGVIYLDDGWQTLVDGLAGAARLAGVDVCTGVPSPHVECRADGWCVSAGDASFDVDGVVLAVSPREASRLAPEPHKATLEAWAKAARPVRAATLDVALRHTPNPKGGIMIDLDEPIYVSTQSLSANVAPDGGAAVHAVRYHSRGEAVQPENVRAALEAALDALQPGWREAVVHARFMPDIVVANRLDLASTDGPNSRPGPAVLGAPGLAVAGDWTGPGDAWLLDQVVESGRAAWKAALAV